MKKLLPLLLIFSLYTGYLFSQTELVIESFDEWGLNGLPLGYEWCMGSPSPELVEQIPGVNGAAIKCINYDNFPSGSYCFSNESNPILLSAPLPDSLYYYTKTSSPAPTITEPRLIVIFYYNGNIVAHYLWYVIGTFPEWVLWEEPILPNIDTLRYFDKITIQCDLFGSPESNNEWRAFDELTLVWNSSINLIEPTSETKWIAGEKRSIEWTALNNEDTLKIEYSTDGGSNFTLIKDTVEASAGQYEWDIPDNVLTTKARIKLTNLNDNNTAESEDFRIKPYIITRLDNNGDYIAYDVDFDRWGFGNTPEEMWPPSYWYGRFDYNTKIDTFTNKVFSQIQGDSTFYYAFAFDFPDWYSFVNAFSVGRCYRHTGLGIYRQSALLKWKAVKGVWGGCCFGIAATNALAFRKRSEFQSKYPYFPVFDDPVNVQSDSNVIPVVTELFVQQFGNPTTLYRNNCWNPHPGKRVNETLQEIKTMLIEDNTPIRTLSMFNNSNVKMGHTINPYLLEQDPDDEWLYYLFVWDNSHPNNTTAIITIDTTAYSNTGRWDPVYAWNGWGGDRWFILEVLSDEYLNGGILPKQTEKQSSSFYWPMGVEIDATENSDVIITDSLGNRTGYADGNVLDEIPNGLPLILTNPVDTPPYGYLLEIRNYSIVLDNFRADTVNAYFFSQNKGFSYERYGAVNTETDRLFFDGGISAVNPDNQTKTVKLLSLIDDTTSAEDKMIVIKSLRLEQNDSVKIMPVDDINFSLISYGNAREYSVVLEYASEQEWQIFGHSNIQLTENTTHTFVPDWPDIYTNQLMILVDWENNGTIDDTLYLENQITDIKNNQGSIFKPEEYRLEQNYPNPFNSSTVIRYSIPKDVLVTLEVYNVIGEKVATLVDEIKEAGSHTVEISANNLPSGVYFYQLKAGNFIQTKKMILLK